MQTAAVVFVDVAEIAVKAVDVPDPGPGQVRVRTRFSTISAGTEGWILHNRFTWSPTRYPCVPGYQRVGLIEALGTDVNGWSVGDRVIDVDLKGAFLCSRYVLEKMVLRKQGNIINIASVHTEATLPEAAPYAAAKGGVNLLTKALAIEFAPHGIRVNAVSPGLTDTQIWQDLQAAAEDAEAARQHWFDNIPLGRVQSPREVANVVLFLASKESSYITGANIMTDGGMTIQLINRVRYASKAVEGKLDEG